MTFKTLVMHFAFPGLSYPCFDAQACIWADFHFTVKGRGRSSVALAEVLNYKRIWIARSNFQF